VNTKEKEKLAKAGVAAVYLFGSTAEGRSSPLSDIDIGIVLRDYSSGSDYRVLYQIVYESMSELFDPDRLHIVMLQDAPLPLQYAAIKEGRIIFENDPVFTADYENSVVKLYMDFKPVLDLFDQTALKRYAEPQRTA
jgi:predicted nucleotidyltransferase